MTRRRGFTLTELLVVLGIIGVLLALIIPAIQKARAAAAKTRCANQMKQLALACQSFHDDYKRFPPAFGFFPRSDPTNGGNALGNAFFHLLPYVEHENLFKSARQQTPAKGGMPALDYFFYMANNVHQTQVPAFNCPVDPTMMGGVNPKTNYAPSSYAGNYLVFGNVYPDLQKGSGPGNAGGQSPFASRNAQGKARIPNEIPDGTSTTILFAEKYASAWGVDPSAPYFLPPPHQNEKGWQGGCHWAYFQADCQNPFFAYYDPAPNPKKPYTDPNSVGPNSARPGFQVQPNPDGGCNPCLPATGHSAMNAAMVDGSVRSLAAGMSRRIWWALVTPNGGELVE